MRPLNRKRKILGFFALAVIVLLLAPFVAVQVQERIFRHRAEQLLADMRSLMMHKASPTEEQAVFKRWNPSDVECSAEACWFKIDLCYGSFPHVLDNSGVPDIDVLWALNQLKLWLRPFRMYGGRLAHVRAYAQVVHGVLVDITFRVDLEVSPPPDDWSTVKEMHQQYILSAAAASTPGFSIPAEWHGLTLHPNYVIAEGYPPARDLRRTPDVYAVFGPHADPADIARLTAFDLSCLTSLMPCRKSRDIMPEAAAQYAKEEPQLAQARKDHVCGPDIVALMARGAGSAGVVEVTGSRVEPHLSEIPIPIVRLVRDFELTSDWKTGESHELLILDPNTNRAVTVLPPEVRLGNRFIMLAESGFHYRWVETYDCGTVPLNPANLELVRDAIAGNLPPAKP
ncbi:MAG: hypothetical protein WAO35_05915 [Terriglobia bacterium]